MPHKIKDILHPKIGVELFPVTYRKKPDNPEHQLQVAVVRLLRQHGINVFAIPNGGRRDVRTGANLKKEGVSAGVSDLEILLPSGRAVFVEMKTLQGRQSESQKAFEMEVKALGFEYYVWRTFNDALNFINSLN